MGLAKDGIHIKKSHKGRFTKWCKEQGYKSVTCGCIKEGLAKGGNVAKQANFANQFGKKGKCT